MGEAVVNRSRGPGGAGADLCPGLQECLLGGVYVPCSNRMPGGVLVGNSGLCCCVPVVRVSSIVRELLIPFVCWLTTLTKMGSVGI